MPDDLFALIGRLTGDDRHAAADLLDEARTAASPALLVTAALLAAAPGDLLERAAAHATTTRDRQLVAIATAHLAHDEDLLDALVRDHLADHPDSLLAAWIAAQHPRSTDR